MIQQTDKEIDDMVYEPYGLSGEEIAIVEGNQKQKGSIYNVVKQAFVSMRKNWNLPNNFLQNLALKPTSLNTVPLFS